MQTRPAVLGWLLALAPLAGIAWVVDGTPGVVAVGALLPPLAYAAVTVAIARGRRASLAPVVTVFALVWGAGIAVLGSAPVNDLLQSSLGRGPVVPVVCAPVVEEAAKGMVLLALVLLWPDSVRSPRCGIVAGALVGFGFAAAENVGYLTLAAVQGGMAGLARNVVVRGFMEGGVHAVFAASTGAGIGYGCGRRRQAPLAAGVGLAAAVTQHVVWNGVGSRMVARVLCNPATWDGACRAAPDAPTVLLVVPAIVAANLAPGVVGLWRLARERA